MSNNGLTATPEATSMVSKRVATRMPIDVSCSVETFVIGGN